MPLTEDPLFKVKLADLELKLRALEITNLRMLIEEKDKGAVVEEKVRPEGATAERLLRIAVDCKNSTLAKTYLRSILRLLENAQEGTDVQTLGFEKKRSWGAGKLAWKSIKPKAN